MTMIHVPRVDAKSAMDKSRPVNTLLRVQIERLHEAEAKLPLAMQTDIYVNAIKTEGEAGDYIRRVTEAIQGAHKAAEARRTRPVVKRKRVIEIAAVADDRPARKKPNAGKGKKSKGKSGSKKKK
jgi:hypothetical protein